MSLRCIGFLTIDLGKLTYPSDFHFNEITKFSAVTELNRRRNLLYLISFTASPRLQAAVCLLRGGRLAKPTSAANIEQVAKGFCLVAKKVVAESILGLLASSGTDGLFVKVLHFV